MPPFPRQPARCPHAVVLMYHAVGAGNDVHGQDARYTLSIETFRRQLDMIGDAVQSAGCVRDWLAWTRMPPVLLSFDDGHASNHRVVWPLLAERGMRADFFVNPANVGQPGFADWPQLREMAAAGMSIQSHGYDHRYFTDRTRHALHDSLRAARIEIEDRIGQSVTLLAPPGGRMPAGLPRIATQCGYRYILSSRPGRLRRGSRACVLPRLAVTTDISEREFRHWIAAHRATIARRAIRYNLLALAKRLLGDARYERARAYAVDGGGSPAWH